MAPTISETVVGPETLISGEIRGGEDIVVRGKVAGAIHLDHTVTVDDGGVVEASVQVRSLLVSGVLVGAVHASDGVRLTGTARVVGDITAPRLILEAGACVRGRLEIGGGEAVRAPRPPGLGPLVGPIAATWPATQFPAVLSGSLDQIGMSSLLTLLEMERRTGVLELRSGPRLGTLALREGFVVNATLDDRSAGTCDAVGQYLRWGGGRFVFRAGEQPGIGDEMAVPTTLLLLEAARRNDEALRGREFPRVVASPASERTPALAGALEHVGITSVLTLLEMERQEGVLELQSRRRTGRLALRAGCVTSASVEGARLPICDAVLKLLGWDQGRFQFRMNEVELGEGHPVRTTLLLMEAGRRADGMAVA